MSDILHISDNTTLKAGIVDPLEDSLYETSLHVRKVLKQDLAECRLSREEIAIRLSVRMGRVSTAMLDAYVAESKANRFPAELISAWIGVTGSRRILDLLCGEVGLSIATQEDRDFAALGRALLVAKKLTKKLAGKV